MPTSIFYKFAEKFAFSRNCRHVFFPRGGGLRRGKFFTSFFPRNVVVFLTENRMGRALHHRLCNLFLVCWCNLGPWLGIKPLIDLNQFISWDSLSTFVELLTL